MVIRKPYAFLIRHFRLIHFLIILPMFVTILCTRSVLDFFSTFVASGYVTNEINIANTYINPIVYLALILIILSTVLIILLLKSKDKDIKAHLITSIFYFILLILKLQMYHQQREECIEILLILFIIYNMLLFY